MLIEYGKDNAKFPADPAGSYEVQTFSMLYLQSETIVIFEERNWLGEMSSSDTDRRDVMVVFRFDLPPSCYYTIAHDRIEVHIRRHKLHLQTHSVTS